MEGKRQADAGDLLGVVALHALLQNPNLSMRDAVKNAAEIEMAWRALHMDLDLGIKEDGNGGQ